MLCHTVPVLTRMHQQLQNTAHQQFRYTVQHLTYCSANLWTHNTSTWVQLAYNTLLTNTVTASNIFKMLFAYMKTLSTCYAASYTGTFWANAVQI